MVKVFEANPGVSSRQSIQHTPPCRAPLLIEGIQASPIQTPLYEEGWRVAPGCAGQTWESGWRFSTSGV